MSTKLTFYCTSYSDGEFQKSIFETIVEGISIKNNYDFQEWIDDNCGFILDEFDLGLVFEYTLLKKSRSNESIENVKVIKKVIGKLSFPKQKKKKIDKLSGIVIKPELITKEYQSCWIDPFGKKYAVGFADHNAFARDWIENTEGHEVCSRILDYYGYYYEYLENKGWIRILGWSNPPCFVLPDKISVSQKLTLKGYCLSEKVDYNEWPEILKFN